MEGLSTHSQGDDVSEGDVHRGPVHLGKSGRVHHLVTHLEQTEHPKTSMGVYCGCDQAVNSIIVTHTHTKTSMGVYCGDDQAVNSVLVTHTHTKTSMGVYCGDDQAVNSILVTHTHTPKRAWESTVERTRQ